MFQKATKKQSKLRLAIYAPSGAGKTFTALRIATGLGGKIALIDSERGSASKYADRFDFDVAELDKMSIESYITTINQAHEYDVLIIDSMSHAWTELLTEIDKLAQAKYKGNSWSAWSEGTPRQKNFVNSILNYPGHIIATMRTKTEWSVEKDEKTGKSRPVKLGLAPEQGKGIEYEFDILMEINHEHYATIAKDRTGKFQDSEILKPGEEFGKELLDWLNNGEKVKTESELIIEAVESVTNCNTLEALTEIWAKTYRNYQKVEIFKNTVIKRTKELKEAETPASLIDAITDLQTATDLQQLDKLFDAYTDFQGNQSFINNYNQVKSKLIKPKN